MPKKLSISLSGIVTQINQAEGRLLAAKKKTASKGEKRKLAVKIKKLKKVESKVRMICKSLTIIVPTE